MRTVSGVEPNTINPPFCRISEIPSVTIELAEMSVIKGAGGAQARDPGDQELMQQRPAGEHDRPSQQRADERADIGSEEGEHATAGDQVQAGEHAEHQQLALGEVDDPHDAENQPEADAHQSVDAADGDARGQRVQHVLDQDLEVHWFTFPPPGGRPFGLLQLIRSYRVFGHGSSQDCIFF